MLQSLRLPRRRPGAKSCCERCLTRPYRCGLALQMLSQLAAEKDFRGAAFLHVECCLAVLQSQHNCEKVAFIVTATGMICDALRSLGLSMNGTCTWCCKRGSSPCWPMKKDSNCGMIQLDSMSRLGNACGSRRNCMPCSTMLTIMYDHLSIIPSNAKSGFIVHDRGIWHMPNKAVPGSCTA